MSEELQQTVKAALLRAYSLGQTYWQQADSEYTSQHRKADITQAKFAVLVEETIAALQPKQPDPETRPSMSMFATAADYNAAMDKWLAPFPAERVRRTNLGE